MSLPGFSADLSLYKTTKAYRMVRTAGSFAPRLDISPTQQTGDGNGNGLPYLYRDPALVAAWASRRVGLLEVGPPSIRRVVSQALSAATRSRTSVARRERQTAAARRIPLPRMRVAILRLRSVLGRGCAALSIRSATTR